MDLYPAPRRAGQGNQSGMLQVCVREDLWLKFWTVKTSGEMEDFGKPTCSSGGEYTNANDIPSTTSEASRRAPYYGSIRNTPDGLDIHGRGAVRDPRLLTITNYQSSRSAICRAFVQEASAGNGRCFPHLHIGLHIYF